MLNIYTNEEWVIDAKNALTFFISRMGDTKWIERRTKVVSYFQEIKNIQYGKKEVESSDSKTLYQ